MNSPAAKRKTPLGNITARGASWVLLVSVIAKLLSFVTQIVLASLLLREDFGQYGMAITVSTIGLIFSQNGIKQILIHRPRSFKVWSNAAFWMSILFGCAACLLLVLFSPAVARFYNSSDPKQLIQLICTLALVYPIQGMATVPEARIALELRFRRLAMMGLIKTTADSIFKMAFAYLGFGALSFCISSVLSTALYAALCFRIAPPIRLQLNPQWRRWKYLLPSNAQIVVTGIAYSLVAQGDYIILGRVTTTVELGLYVFAFSVSMRTLQLIAGSLGDVFLAVLAQLRDDASRQYSAFLRIAKIMAAISIPLCVAQAFVARPVVHLIFPERWYPATRLIEIMSIGMTIRPIAWTCASLLKAQGRFRTLMFLSLWTVAIFFVFAISGVMIGGLIGLTIAVAAFYLAIALVGVHVTIYPRSIGNFSLNVILAPAIASAAAFAAAKMSTHMLLGSSLPSKMTLFFEAFTLLTVGLILYTAILRSLSPDTYQEALTQVKSLLNRIRGKGPAVNGNQSQDPV